MVFFRLFLTTDTIPEPECCGAVLMGAGRPHQYRTTKIGVQGALPPGGVRGGALISCPNWARGGAPKKNGPERAIKHVPARYSFSVNGRNAARTVIPVFFTGRPPQAGAGSSAGTSGVDSSSGASAAGFSTGAGAAATGTAGRSSAS